MNNKNQKVKCGNMRDKSIYDDYLNSDFNEDFEQLKPKAIMLILFLNTIFIWGSMLVLIDEGNLFVSSVILSLTVYLDYTICKNTRYMLRKQESKREWITKEIVR